jgi:hypothetical protein
MAWRAIVGARGRFAYAAGDAQTTAKRSLLGARDR